MNFDQSSGSFGTLRYAIILKASVEVQSHSSYLVEVARDYSMRSGTFLMPPRTLYQYHDLQHACTC